MPQFCINAVVGTLLKDYVQQPCHDELLDEIKTHKYVVLRIPSETDFISDGAGYWFAILHVTSDSVVVQEVEMTAGETRFIVRIVKCVDWNEVFVGWVDEDHERWNDCDYAWQVGMGMYGADTD